ncbi:phenolic acid decarboxylase subunit C [Ruminiclostridium hungatei]|uniref:Phenolic acid decarboxylase subunit C n=1 Tax=Ruminiclostridium hungatei TaxID=48256 RepID=A0A1V4SJE5_RUMHU|nr:UbiD family decarboxylase [Ruminiclostridium hungatei]OPX43371.1 phenolic acid decarboxylase subunit C [Ruminiclostridium hungatei]
MEKINDLRSAVSFLESNEEYILEHNEPIDAHCEIAAHYVKHGAGVPASPNCREGSAVIYRNVKNHSMPVLMGLFGSRRRSNLLLTGKDDNTAAEVMLHGLMNRLPAEKMENPPCQENIIRAVDIMKQLPVPTISQADAGPFITLGVVYAADPETGEKNCSIHRFCIHGKDTMTIWIVPGRDLGILYKKALERNTTLPISINIGVDPAVYYASCFSNPPVAPGEDELSIAGGIRKYPVQVSECVSVDALCISNAEIVLEGEITGELANENVNDPTGFSLPEFLGYNGYAKPSIPLVKIKAVTHRNDAVYQALLGPGKEQSELLSIPAEAAVMKLLKENLRGEVINAHYSSAGGGLLFLILQIRKKAPVDDAFARQAGLMALSSFHMLKHVIVVDEDVNIYSHEDVLWAMTTRFQADEDIALIKNLPGFPADPSQSPQYSRSIPAAGVTAKAVFDCTVPWGMKALFKRSF